MYAIRGIHKVYPYGWTMYATTRYSNEIKRGGIEDEMISATPADKDIELNESTAYSISISYQLVLALLFLGGKKREQEWLQDGMTIDMKLFFQIQMEL